MKIIVFWCIVLVHTNSNYELDVHFRGMTISTEKPTKPVNSRRYHKIIYDNGKYYQFFHFGVVEVASSSLVTQVKNPQKFCKFLRIF